MCDSVVAGQVRRSIQEESQMRGLQAGRRAALRALGCVLLTMGLAGTAHAQCELNSPTGQIKHVVYVEFDNVHFTRDNPNVPSDLEQMPNLLNFIKQNGTLDAGDHTVLISHTANDILTTQTGLYSDDTGIFIANSFGVFGPGTGVASIYFPSSFFYWTDKVSDITPATDDNNFALTTPSGLNVPAPWVPFTRAGCDVGAFSTANIVLERTPFDVQKVFGPTSSQAAESTSTSVKPNQTDDFEGASIHCAIGSSLCSTANGGVPDLLPDEPGTYAGYEALFGLKYIAPALGGITDYNGNAITGFQALNFDPTPAQTLAVVETMLKKGIPVVFAYIADAHDNQEGSSLSSEKTFGPGEAPYVKQLADYNAAFGKFFADLKADGIDQSNTLFVFTPDEGDHFVGGTPSPANCDGAKIEGGAVVPDVPCTYAPGGVGELDINLGQLVLNAGDSTPFSIHFDDSATTFVPGQPIPSDSSLRALEKTMAGLSAVNPNTGMSESLLGLGLGADLHGALVDPVAQKLLHMNTVADPAREPSFTFFGDPNFYFETSGSATPVVSTTNAWNHGDIQPEIGRTFIGIVGPGVRNLGITQPSEFYTDHVDLRPTMMLLTGLRDDYEHDGRVITELLDPSILPASLHAHSAALDQLGQAYKQIDAPFGDLAQSTLTVSTYAILSDSPGDATYTALENEIASWTSERDDLAAQIKGMLEDAEFYGIPVNKRQADSLIGESQGLLFRAEACAWNPKLCAVFAEAF
jgi:hypothetical protein